MIRHYEKIGLVPQAPRRESGYRDYSDADVNRLYFIANARYVGFPMEKIGTLPDPVVTPDLVRNRNVRSLPGSAI